jgi:hypothetical protein
MSVVDHEAAAPTRHGLQFGTIVIVGGGCYGSYYARQLLRAKEAGAASWQHLVVVDREPRCAVATTYRREDVELSVSDWRSYFADYLSYAASNPDPTRADAIVPSPLMPHLMFDWLVDRARARWPERHIRPEPLLVPPDTPWQRAAPDGTRYVSFAEWMCPINCIEPRRCPHTRGERSWSLPETAREYVRRARERGEPLAGPVIFHCVHRTYGVGMFDTRDVLAGDDLVRIAAESVGAAILIGTMSHCHGAFARLVVGPPRPSDSGVSTH